MYCIQTMTINPAELDLNESFGFSTNIKVEVKKGI